MKKRLLALLLAASIALSFVGCAPKDGGNEPTGNASSGNGIFDEPVTISIMVPQGNELFKDDWKVWEYMREATGADIDMIVNVTDSATKIAVAFASQEAMPDLVAFDSKSGADDYAAQGALVAIDDWEDQMPNYKAFWEKIDPAEREEIMRRRRSADGKNYYPPRYGREMVNGVKTWIYREDIFEKHGLEQPKTYDEMYDVAKKLKELYPDSYPISCENFYAHIATTLGPQWKPYFEYSEYYDFKNDEWHFGAGEDTMLEMVKVFKRFYEEGLINPDFISTSTREFGELVTSGRTFIFPGFFNRISMYMNAMAGIDDTFSLAPMTPPVANTETGTPLITNYCSDAYGFVIPNNGDEKRIANTIKFMDWLYSDEAVELMSWGKEGDTYEVVDGKKKFILGEGEDVGNKYGFQTYGAGLVFDPEAVLEIFTDDSVTADDFVTMRANIEEEYNPKRWLAFTDDENDKRYELLTALTVYAQEMTSKFMLGQKPLSEWDSYVETLNEMGIEELLGIYKEVYDRSK